MYFLTAMLAAVRRIQACQASAHVAQGNRWCRETSISEHVRSKAAPSATMIAPSACDDSKRRNVMDSESIICNSTAYSIHILPIFFFIEFIHNFRAHFLKTFSFNRLDPKTILDSVNGLQTRTDRSIN